MNKAVDVIVYVLFLAIFSFILTIQIGNLSDRIKTIEPKYPITIDIPEEYKAISNNPNNRTNLSGYIQNDTLFIEFKH
jgi:hypothetical protein